MDMGVENRAFSNEEINSPSNKKQAISKHADIKHLQEHYDEITDNKLPDYLHRGDITSVNRFLGYHDAMMATCGTFLVLPCLLYTSPSPRDKRQSRMPSSA